MILHYLTLFPELINDYFKEGLLSRAISNNRIKKNTILLRDFSTNKYKSVDDKSYGGSDGMVLNPEPVVTAIESIRGQIDKEHRYQVVLLSPQGERCNQDLLKTLSLNDEIVFVCGRYAGFDHRITQFCDLEISIGDYVLSGGELPALVLTEGLLRYQKGFLGNDSSVENDSFAKSGLLESPQFTTPQNFRNLLVPKVLLSGNHAQIKEWKDCVAVLITLKKRPDLFRELNLDCESRSRILQFYLKMELSEKKEFGIDGLESALGVMQ